MNRITLAAVFSLVPLSAFAQAANGKPANLVPAGYRIVEEIKGDLNKDGLEDYVFIIQGTKNVSVDENCMEGEDCNRRGVVIAFNKGGGYERVLENRDCFYSENTLSAYFAPVLSVRVKKGNLYVEYEHGKYGNWSYTFRYQNSDFELIGYDAYESDGPYAVQEVSVNFLTKKMLTKKNTNERCKGEECEEKDPVFKETWKNITLKEPIKLRKINFDEFSIWNHVKTGE